MAEKSMTFSLFGKDVSASKALHGVGETAHTVGGRLGEMGTAFAGIGTAAAIAGVKVAVDFGKESVHAFMEAQAESAKFDYAFEKFPGIKKYKGQIDSLAESLALKTKYDVDATKAAAGTLAQFGLSGQQLTKLIPLTQDFASATGKDLGDASTLLGRAMQGNVKALKAVGIQYKPTHDAAKDFANITDLLSKKVGGFAAKEGQTAAGTAAILANQFGEVKKQVGSYLVPALTKLGQYVITNVIPAIQKLVTWFQAYLWPIIQRVATWVMTKGVPAFRHLVDMFMKNVWPAIQNVATLVMTKGIPAFGNLVDMFMKNVWPAIQNVARIVADNLQPAVEALGDFWTNTLVPGFKDMLPILVKVGRIFGIVGGVILVVASWIIGKLAPAFFNILGGAIRFGVALFGKMTDAITWVIDVMGGLISFFQSAPGKISGALSGMWNGLVSGFKSAINTIIGWWNGLHFSVPRIDIGPIHAGGGTIDFPNVPYLAKGGIVSHPTLAMIGERGPEAVVPLGRLGSTGGGLHVHVHTTAVVDNRGMATLMDTALGVARAQGWKPRNLAVS